MSPATPTGADPATLTATQAARRERVLRAALDLGAEGGYDAVQMRTVAARSEVALGTIYRYFSSKDHLLAAALVTWTNDLERQVARRPPKGKTPSARVGDVLRRATAGMERQPQLTEAVILAISSPDPGAASCQGEVAGAMARVMDRAMPDDLDPEERANAARVLNFVWYGALLGWVNGWTGTDDVGREITRATELILRQFD
ncbi:TetR family transcriptional regulator [Iamia majanohamensis]|uniref:TetR family transcriptional regulator n=1 Tax=Iamia majanohamensis TaxID=467976 RepID=A0AAE9YDZ6_9ACTN|nr:TetR family transcriptional regulator [Iamia majanohamensis]WCO66101.1 TetR family transcriptional regulator [Iamia majanohamensis]